MKFLGLNTTEANPIKEETVPAETPTIVSPAPPPKEIEVIKENYKEDYGYFERIGKSFYIYPENEYLLKKHGLKSAYSSIKTFLPQPDSTVCKDDYCRRKVIFAKTKFTLESIVEPVGGAAVINNKSDEEYSCKNKIFNCYYKAKFENDEIGYMLIADFDSASDPINSTSSHTPSRLQIQPVAPDKKWKESKRFYDNYFKKLSVKEGFTRDEVLRSGWGKPYSRTKSSIGKIEVEIWTYQNGMITFENGYVSQITEVSY